MRFGVGLLKAISLTPLSSCPPGHPHIHGGPPRSICAVLSWRRSRKGYRQSGCHRAVLGEALTPALTVEQEGECLSWGGLGVPALGEEKCSSVERVEGEPPGGSNLKVMV